MAGSTLRSLGDDLRVVEPHMSPELVSPSGFARLHTLAASLPPQSIVGFECRLAGDSREPDLAVALPPNSPGWNQFAGDGPQNGLLAPLLANPIWHRVHTLCRLASEPQSVLHDRLGTIWLEFDLKHHGPGVPVPNVLFGLRPGQRVERVGMWQAIEPALEILTGDRLPGPLRDTLERCFSARPAGAYIFQVGVMLGRPIQGVRVCLANVSLDGMAEYLVRLGWAGQREEFIDTCFPLTSPALRVALGIDVMETIAPRIGVECYLHRGKRTRIEGSWVQLLDGLVDRGMCRPEKRSALLRWPGQSQARFLWPVTIARGLNHIKLVYQPGCALQAKAYFGFACVT